MPPSKPEDLQEQIRKLNAIGIALSSERDLNKLLELIVSEARNFTQADGGSLYILEEDKLHFAVAQTFQVTAARLHAKRNRNIVHFLRSQHPVRFHFPGV